jgi:hypothetical protein
MEEHRSDLVVNGRIMRDLFDAAIARARCITTGDRPDYFEVTSLRANDL